MITNPPDTDQRELEAADWFARLSRTPIETEELTKFQRWSRDPANLAAYNEIEDISRAVRGLRDDPAMRAAAKEALARPPERTTATTGVQWRFWGAGLAFAGVVAAAVRLNTDSELRVRFSVGQRRIDLIRGQAYFEVTHDASRPFVVVAGPAQVRAVGTQFDVRRADAEVRVVLAQGRVAVTDKHVAPSGWTLTPGQGLVLRPSSSPRPTEVDVDALTSWRTGTLTFHNVTLAEAVAELNRYTETQIVLDASTPRQLVVNGAFRAGDTNEFISAASLLYGLTARTRPDGTIELRAQGAPT
jgi:transmembrane sensor